MPIGNGEAQKLKSDRSVNRAVGRRVHQRYDATNAGLLQQCQIIFEGFQRRATRKPALGMQERKRHASQLAWNDPVNGRDGFHGCSISDGNVYRCGSTGMDSIRQIFFARNESTSVCRGTG